MQKVFAYIGVLVVGVVIGCLLPNYHFRDEMETMQRDTVTVYDTMRYSRFELVRNTYTLKIPKVDVPNLAFLDVEKIDTIYKDNVMYISYPRENYYTKTEDAEIWHSGIDSTIDSLNVVRKTQNITETIAKKDKRNFISLGAEVSYAHTFYIPIYLQYERMLHRNASFYARVLYDLPSQSWGAGVGARLRIGW